MVKLVALAGFSKRDLPRTITPLAGRGFYLQVVELRPWKVALVQLERFEQGVGHLTWRP